MKIMAERSALVAALAFTSVGVRAQDCTTYQETVAAAGMPLQLDYVADVNAGLFRGRLVYEGLGWVGFAVSPTGQMVGSQAVIGQFGEGVARYDLGGYSIDAVTLNDMISAPAGVTETCTQNDTHTVMEFAVPLENSDPTFSIDTSGGVNNLLVAAGADNMLAYHAIRSPLEVVVNPCEAAAAAGGMMEDDTAPAPAPAVDLASLMIGDTVTHEGFVMDQFCIGRGTFLDQPDVIAIQNPDKHTVHCLIDAPPCIATPFELLQDPAEGETNWTRAFVLDQDSKDTVVALAKELGVCDECTGEGHLSMGLRVRVTGEVTALADPTTGVPATLSATSIESVFPFVGQGIEVTSFISDQFCLQRGTFLDNDLPSLEMPEAHTVHCLIDPPPCIGSPFEVLLPPLEGETEYRRGYTLDAKSKGFFVELIRRVGVCDTCHGNGTIEEGFQALLKGTVVNDQRNLTSGSGPLITVRNAWPVSDDMLMVGDEIVVEGYVVDQFCLDRGTFLDTGLPTLENADRHTLHCLLDPPPCLETAYEIVMDPNHTAGETMWSRGYTLDEASKQTIIELGRSIGNCDTCTGGEGGQLEGFRVRLNATVLDNLPNETTGGGPLISVNSAESVGQYVVGQSIQIEGYIMDQFCIQRGTFLDTGLPALPNADKHTVHCLIDPPPCLGSPFEVLLDPVMEGGNWTRGFTLDGASKTQVIDVIKEVGDCDTCTGAGTLKAGFRALITGTIVNPNRNATSGAGPVISVVEVEPILPAQEGGGMLEVGQEIMAEGYLIDEFCLTRGAFLDTGLAPLENANRHTLHCLLDPPPCLETAYEIVMDPDYAAGETMWKRGYTLDAASKQTVLELARSVGNCDTCSGGATGQLEGFRVRVTATVVDNMRNETTGGGPLISVSTAESVGQYFEGQVIQVTGYIMDQFCIQRGTFLDTGLPSLANADKHTVHCLIDPPPCLGSPFEVLHDPVMEGGNWTRGFTLDADSKALVLDVIKEVGDCDTCTGAGTLKAGFRATITATIVNPMMNATSGSGPLISVTEIVPIIPAAEEVTYEVGQEVIVEGYLIDEFCLTRGAFLDTGLAPLENANRHTLHCLLDPPPCLETAYEVVLDPDFAAGETMWKRGYTLDAAGKQTVLELARSVGNCDTCTGGATGQLEGFRVRLNATIVDNMRNETTGGGPLISVNSAESVGQYVEGQVIQIEGYIMDQFCIQRGRFLDTDLPALANADKHTVHCLVDPPPCIGSAYEVLHDPIMEGGNWTRGFTLDADSKAKVLDVIKGVGVCDTCTGTLEAGFRALITATIVDPMRNTTSGGGPLISITDIDAILPAEEEEAGVCGPTTEVYADIGITLTYEVGTDDATGAGTLTAEVVYEGQGWVGFAISESGGMVGSLGIIGLPDEDVSGSNPGKYLLGGFSPDQITLTDQQTLIDGNIVQNDTHTVLTFTKLLEEPDELAINSGGANNFLIAGGPSNELSYHQTNRQAIVVTLSCGGAVVADADPVEDAPEEDAVGEDCDSTFTEAFDAVGISLTYELGTDEASGMGTFSAEVVYEGQGWVGFAISESGGMVGSLGIIGLPDEDVSGSNPGKYLLGGFSPDQITLTDQQTLIDGNVVQNDTHTVLTFTKLLEEPDELAINAGGANNFLVAGGPSNELSYHQTNRQAFVVTLACPSLGGAEPAAVEDVAEAPAPAPVPAPAAAAADVDCSQFQNSHTFTTTPGITLNYVVNLNETSGDGTFSGQVVYEGQGWVGFGISPDGQMLGSLAIIGLPDEDVSQTNPGEYMLISKTDNPNLLANDFQTVIDGNIEQNDTHTVLTFTKRLSELGEIEIDPMGNNFFIVAAGSDNTLAYHAVREAVELELAPCNVQPAAAACELPPVTEEFDEVPITFTYELGVDEETGMGTISGEVVYEGLGWVGFAISEAGRMVGSLAIIGLPDEEISASNPGKYFLGGLDTGSVALTDQQTLIDGNIVQNDTHTVLTFTKFLEEPDELAINPSGPNNFLVAGGPSNELSYHQTNRHAFVVTLTCPAAGVEEPVLDVEVGDVVTLEGFVMDNWCINLTYLLDAPDIVTLEEPNLHSFHCLIDVDVCRNSNYELLLDPLPGETMYRRALTFDDSSKEVLIETARSIGECESCTGANRATHGFRAYVNATITELANLTSGAPPVAAVSDIQEVLFVTDSSTQVTFEVGDRVTVVGFIMDRFCIDRGTLLDNSAVVTLEGPDQHSVHCLIDIQSCADSAYEVLLDPIPGSADQNYTRGFVLDDAGKALVRDLAKEVGICDDCDGTGDWERGFRARIMGTILDLGSDEIPPLISVQMATPVPFDGMMAMEEVAETPAPITTTADDGGAVDCSQFQAAFTFDFPVTMEWVVNVDDVSGAGNLSMRVTYAGQGWVGWAISTDGSMVGSEAVIGLPDDGVSASNPGKYNLGAQSPSGVTLFPDAQQTVMDGNIEQNDTHTTLTFTKILVEEGEIPIDPNGLNWFLVAAGTENALGFHVSRGALQVPLAPCTAEGGGADVSALAPASSDRMENHFKAHGWLLVIAWGILVPIAIGNSLARHLIPVQGLWFEVHRAFNSLAIVLTIIGFAIVVNALQQTSSNPEHFKPIDGGIAGGKHKTIGLVVFILALIQGIGGVMRPHLPAKNDDGTDAEPKSAVRTMWEFAHRGSGIAILAMAWYQCHSGLATYASSFGAEDYTDVFWGVTGAISAIAVIGGLTRFIMPETQKPAAVPTDEQPNTGDGTKFS